MKKKIKCPFCSNKAILDKDVNDVDVNIDGVIKRVNVEFYHYICHQCWNSYTTTEIDELNISSINIQKRRARRLITISNLFK